MLMWIKSANDISAHFLQRPNRKIYVLLMCCIGLGERSMGSL